MDVTRRMGPQESTALADLLDPSTDAKQLAGRR
jgi:hypothetical protein